MRLARNRASTTIQPLKGDTTGVKCLFHRVNGRRPRRHDEEGLPGTRSMHAQTGDPCNFELQTETCIGLPNEWELTTLGPNSNLSTN